MHLFPGHSKTEQDLPQCGVDKLFVVKGVSHRALTTSRLRPGLGPMMMQNFFLLQPTSPQSSCRAATATGIDTFPQSLR